MVQYRQALDTTFAALSDPTRRGVLQRASLGDVSISDLAAEFGMTLTGMKKHVRVLEAAGLVTTEKVGRVRYCRPGPKRLSEETAWLEAYREMVEARLDRLAVFLEKKEGKSS